MISAVIDTHALIWFLLSDVRLSKTARDFLETVRNSDGYIAVSAITFIEVAYLVEKQRLPSNTYEEISAEVQRLDTIFQVIDVSRIVADNLRVVSREHIPDMPDRIIAATAFSLSVPVITRDRLIAASNIQTIW